MWGLPASVMDKTELDAEILIMAAKTNKANVNKTKQEKRS